MGTAKKVRPGEIDDKAESGEDSNDEFLNEETGAWTCQVYIEDKGVTTNVNQRNRKKRKASLTNIEEDFSKDHSGKRKKVKITASDKKTNSCTQEKTSDIDNSDYSDEANVNLALHDQLIASEQNDSLVNDTINDNLTEDSHSEAGTSSSIGQLLVDSPVPVITNSKVPDQPNATLVLNDKDTSSPAVDSNDVNIGTNSSSLHLAEPSIVSLPTSTNLSIDSETISTNTKPQQYKEISPEKVAVKKERDGDMKPDNDVILNMLEVVDQPVPPEEEISQQPVPTSSFPSTSELAANAMLQSEQQQQQHQLFTQPNIEHPPLNIIQQQQSQQLTQVSTDQISQLPIVLQQPSGQNTVLPMDQVIAVTEGRITEDQALFSMQQHNSGVTTSNTSFVDATVSAHNSTNLVASINSQAISNETNDLLTVNAEDIAVDTVIGVDQSIVEDDSIAADKDIAADNNNDNDSLEEPVSPPHFTLADYKLDPDLLLASSTPTTTPCVSDSIDDEREVPVTNLASISSKLRNLPGLKIVRRVEQCQPPVQV